MLSDHAEGLIQSGSVKIGTLYDFRREATYGEWVGDRTEGFEYRVDFRDYYVDENFAGTRLKDTRVNFGDSPSVQIQYASPDYFIYCTTKNIDRIHAESAGYDACVMIRDSGAFFSKLTIALNGLVPLVGPTFDSREVQYLPRTSLFDSSEEVLTENLWCTKSDQDRYVKQCEIRTKWALKTPIGKAPLPLLEPFEVEGVREYCERIY